MKNTTSTNLEILNAPTQEYIPVGPLPQDSLAIDRLHDEALAMDSLRSAVIDIEKTQRREELQKSIGQKAAQIARESLLVGNAELNKDIKAQEIKNIVPNPEVSAFLYHDENGDLYFAMKPNMVDMHKLEDSISDDFNLDTQEYEIAPPAKVGEEIINLNLPAVKLSGIEPELEKSWALREELAAEIMDSSKVPTDELKIADFTSTAEVFFPVEKAAEYISKRHENASNLHEGIKEEVTEMRQWITSESNREVTPLARAA
jgi:hypothetical protein